MHWMQWVREQQGKIWVGRPLFPAAPGRKKLAGWLVARDGCLQAVYAANPLITIVPAAAVPVEYTRCGEITFAGGLRPSGAGRLSGVLHYFTRGPDGIL